MSSPSITDLPTDPADIGGRSLVRTVVAPVRRAAFWAAIVLPFLHLPLLVTGLESETKTFAFVLLLVLNVATLVIGHPTRNG